MSYKLLNGKKDVGSVLKKKEVLRGIMDKQEREGCRKVILHNILRCPLIQLGDGDGGREGAEEGEEEDGEEARTPHLSIKGHNYMNMVK